MYPRALQEPREQFPGQAAGTREATRHLELFLCAFLATPFTDANKTSAFAEIIPPSL